MRYGDRLVAKYQSICRAEYVHHFFALPIGHKRTVFDDCKFVLRYIAEHAAKQGGVVVRYRSDYCQQLFLYYVCRVVSSSKTAFQHGKVAFGIFKVDEGGGKFYLKGGRGGITVELHLVGLTSHYAYVFCYVFVAYRTAVLQYSLIVSKDGR